MTYNSILHPQKKLDSYQFIIDTLTQWKITLYTGVTGGGVIHFLKYINPISEISSDQPAFLTIAEYSAGFIPLGYYLGNGRIAAAVATTGAATKLICCGLSDAKLHDIPAVYIVPVSGKSTSGYSPLQDTSEYGSNILIQLQAELPDSVFILNSKTTLEEKLSLAKIQLDRSKPIMLVLDNEGLNALEYKMPPVAAPPQSQISEVFHINIFIDNFRKEINGKRLVIFVGEEMARYPAAKQLTNELCTQLQSAVIWSINGANAISRKNPYGYGYFSFGGNDKTISLYNSLGINDVLLILGACPDEYTVNFKKFSASSTFYIGNIPEAYGLVENSLQHVVTGKYHQLSAPIDLVIKQLIEFAKKQLFSNVPMPVAPDYLNDHPFAPARKNYVNMATLYQRLDHWWPADSIGIDDVCLAYKDRQYVIQRPNDNIRFFSLYRGSAMGGAFGVAVGAKLSNLDNSVFLFTGDGCFRLFSGSLGEACNLGLVIFLLNNETLGIVDQGLAKILPDIPATHYHTRLNAIDYCGIAKASGWDTERLNSDLSNLDGILSRINNKMPRSLLIEVPVDSHQSLGNNPRLKNL
ncbi:thiamine pyrophosphate-dependent enzyme [Pedobacter cryoconitis]|uniref:Acetolactate synthase-1/2/3 large subunit n=1 Tax=Pedobacter cryoconitis TaxID=188932 RepID=A0A327SAF2_9SPHI|nr:thiamine pyrophosphate-dependent enzyme [Pedobacter cryoconitis]RAJ26059.1 acetolactate synthase-1/2/3 large subunit [Pedobacter cryoconitis]